MMKMNVNMIANKIRQKVRKALIISQTIKTPLPFGRGWGWAGGIGRAVGLVVLQGGLLFSSCRDSFDINDLHEQPKLVVSCFPSLADTTWISVTHSVPVSGEGRKSGYDLTVSDAFIYYKVNGQPQEVHKDLKRFYVVAKHQPGDRIEMDVTAPGYDPVHAATVVPDVVPVTLRGITETKIYDPYYEESVDVYQLAATFTDPAATQDYYAVRISVRHFQGLAVGDLRPDAPYYDYYDRHVEWPITSQVAYDELVTNASWGDIYDFHLRVDTVYTYPEIKTAGEPLLQPLSDIDGDFGFENEFYQQFYIFSDALISGQTYTMHLCVSNWAGVLNTHMFQPAEFEVDLYHLTPEFYRFVKSINDVDNNELARGGFSLLSPTYTNVAGGIGILGGYAVNTSNPLTLNTTQT